MGLIDLRGMGSSVKEERETVIKKQCFYLASLGIKDVATVLPGCNIFVLGFP